MQMHMHMHTPVKSGNGDDGSVDVEDAGCDGVDGEGDSSDTVAPFSAGI